MSDGPVEISYDEPDGMSIGFTYVTVPNVESGPDPFRGPHQQQVAEQCRMCGRYLASGVPGWPQPLLPGDIPARREVCDVCAENYGPFPDEPCTPNIGFVAGGPPSRCGDMTAGRDNGG